jgi:hypothetical protein
LQTIRRLLVLLLLTILARLTVLIWLIGILLPHGWSAGVPTVVVVASIPVASMHAVLLRVHHTRILVRLLLLTVVVSLPVLLSPLLLMRWLLLGVSRLLLLLLLLLRGWRWMIHAARQLPHDRLTRQIGVAIKSNSTHCDGKRRDGYTRRRKSQSASNHQSAFAREGKVREPVGCSLILKHTGQRR